MKITEVKSGDCLVADGGFTCLAEGDVREVKLGRDGLPYIECSDGYHYLIGQVGPAPERELIGLTKQT